MFMILPKVPKFQLTYVIFACMMCTQTLHIRVAKDTRKLSGSCSAFSKM